MAFFIFMNIRRALPFAVLAFFTFIAGVRPARATMVSLTFDDGLAGVYAHAYPILKKYGVPGVSGIITSRIDPGNDDYMTWDQIRELAANGWEIASHSVNHARPIQVPVFYAQERIAGWYRDNPDQPIYQAHYDYEMITGLFEGERPLTPVETLKELKYKPGTYFFDRIIEELHVRPFSPPLEPGDLDIRAFSYEREMEQSKKDLEAQGLTVATFVAPYNYWTDEVKQASKRFYENAVLGKGEDNRPGTFDRYDIKRFMVHKNDSLASLMRIVTDNAKNKNSWVIFCLHGIGDNTGWEPWSADKLDRFIAWLKGEGIEIVTISQGAGRMAALPAPKCAPAAKISGKKNKKMS